MIWPISFSRKHRCRTRPKPLLHSSFRDARKIRDRYIRVHIDHGFFTLILIKDDALQFFNTFRVRNDSDILYYLLNSFNRFNIPAEEPVYFSGDILKYDELYNNILRYSTTLKFAKPQGDFSLSYIFDDMAVHRYCNLFNIVSCA
ncbi:MAG: DUF3822 family protein [Bacteroidales bacterium]|nr:DUF3822 family protein [Bacteroidales bacterium]